jgi:flagellar hook-associated protein 1 FlgK
MISRVLNYALGAQQQDGVAQPTFNTTGLGADGSLSAPFGSPPTLSEYATDMVAAQSQQSATTSSQLTMEQSVQTGIKAQVNTVSGVNMDTEMSMMISLQNAYGANAKVITAMQSMFTTLLQAVQ